jgi:hypothetical protein
VLVITHVSTVFYYLLACIKIVVINPPLCLLCAFVCLYVLSPCLCIAGRLCNWNMCCALLKQICVWEITTLTTSLKSWYTTYPNLQVWGSEKKNPRVFLHYLIYKFSKALSINALFPVSPCQLNREYHCIMQMLSGIFPILTVVTAVYGVLTYCGRDFGSFLNSCNITNKCICLKYFFFTYC